MYDKAGELVRSEHYGSTAIFSYTTGTEGTGKEYRQRMREWERPIFEAGAPKECHEAFARLGLRRGDRQIRR